MSNGVSNIRLVDFQALSTSELKYVMHDGRNGYVVLLQVYLLNS